METEKFQRITKELKDLIWGNQQRMSNGELWENSYNLAVKYVLGAEEASDEEQKAFYKDRLEVLQGLRYKHGGLYLEGPLPTYEKSRRTRFKNEKLKAIQERLERTDSISERTRLERLIDDIDRFTY